jgi:hypothetical protein
MPTTGSRVRESIAGKPNPFADLGVVAPDAGPFAQLWRRHNSKIGGDWPVVGGD